MPPECKALHEIDLNTTPTYALSAIARGYISAILYRGLLTCRLRLSLNT